MRYGDCVFVSSYHAGALYYVIMQWLLHYVILCYHAMTAVECFIVFFSQSAIVLPYWWYWYLGFRACKLSFCLKSCYVLTLLIGQQSELQWRQWDTVHIWLEIFIKISHINFVPSFFLVKATNEVSRPTCIRVHSKLKQTS